MTSKLFLVLAALAATAAAASCGSDPEQSGDTADIYSGADLDQTIDDARGRASQKTADSAPEGMCDLGSQGDWAYFYDEPSQLVIAINGDNIIAYNKETMAAGVWDGMTQSCDSGQKLASGVSMASIGGMLCRAACWALAGAGCGVVGAACTGVSVITIGGTTIPCVWAIAAACGASGAGGSICSDNCPD